MMIADINLHPKLVNSSPTVYDVRSGGFRPGPERHTGPPSFVPAPSVSWPPMIFCKDNVNIWCLRVSKVSKSGQICGS